MDERGTIGAYYDAVAGDYDVRHGVACPGQAFNFRAHYEPFLARHVPAAGRVLEIGCGTGFYTRWLVERGLDVVAMDLSGPMIDQARRRCADAEYVEGDCQDPASAMGPDRGARGFDAIVGVNSFSYYPDKDAALANYARLLRPGGRFVIVDMNGASPAYGLMALVGKNELGEWLPLIRESTPGGLRPRLEGNGFGIEAMDRFAFIPNAVGDGAVTLLRPLDALLGALPGLGGLAMRIAISARLEVAMDGAQGP